MATQSLPFHEAFELHEVLNFKTIRMVRNDLEWLKTLPDKTSSGFFKR